MIVVSVIHFATLGERGNDDERNTSAVAKEVNGLNVTGIPGATTLVIKSKLAVAYRSQEFT